MAFFDFLKGKNISVSPAAVSFPAGLGAPVGGTFVPMSRIPDEVFSTGVLGICCGIEPVVGKVCAPIDGKIRQLADTLHAVGLEAGGIEILIHVGVDTVEMNGDGFKGLVRVGQNVKKRDLLLTMDLAKIHQAGHPATVIMAVTNSDDFSRVEGTVSGAVPCGGEILRVEK